MVRDLLQKKGIYDAVMKNVETRLTKGHSNLGNLLKTGAVDAVLMWNGVANTFEEHLDVVKTPYEYDSEEIEGFSHTHLEGPGGGSNGYSQILFMATSGKLRTRGNRYASTFSHDQETAAPGYYAVRLADYDIGAELTATMHCGFHRYTFPGGDDSHILLDLGHTRGMCLGGRLEVLGNHAVQGYGHYSMHPMLTVATLPDPGITAEMKVYFYAEFDRPFRSHGTWRKAVRFPGAARAAGKNIGAWFDYGVEAGRTVQVKVALSYISVEQARENLATEIPEWDFERVRQGARKAWNEKLNRLAVTGGTQDDKVKLTPNEIAMLGWP